MHDNRQTARQADSCEMSNVTVEVSCNLHLRLHLRVLAATCRWVHVGGKAKLRVKEVRPEFPD